MDDIRAEHIKFLTDTGYTSWQEWMLDSDYTYHPDFGWRDDQGNRVDPKGCIEGAMEALELAEQADTRLIRERTIETAFCTLTEPFEKCDVTDIPGTRGWVYHFANQSTVSIVVMENGMFSLWQTTGPGRGMFESYLTAADVMDKLRGIRAQKES